MKKINIFRTAIVFLAFFLISAYIFSQTVTVDGYAFLENQTEHDSIQIVFERIAPGQLFDTVYTNSIGYFNKVIPSGLFNVTYSKKGYFHIPYFNINLFSDYTFSDTTLFEKETIINVPSDFPLIQIAIDYAVDGDTVIINTGTYYENINFLGKAITVTSLFIFTNDTTYISQTIIDGNQIDRVVEFNSGESNNSKLAGLTITNGLGSGTYHNGGGAGVYCNSYSSPTLSNLIVTGNTTSSVGGGIFCNGSEPIINRVTITNNSADFRGGGICIFGDSPLITNVIISGNSSESGGGLFCDVYSTPNIKNVIISENVAQEGGGVFCNYSSPLFVNTIICGNSITDGLGGGIYCCDESNPSMFNSVVSNNSGVGIYNSGVGFFSVYYSNIWDNTNGNFYNCDAFVGVNVAVNANGDSIDPYFNLQLSPQFIDASNKNYRLQLNSPCIDAGINDWVSIEYDLDGNVRIWDGNNDGDAIVDMGVYEYGSIPYFPPTSTFTCPDNICVNDTAYIEYTGNATDTANYYRDFDGGITISGSGQGPYEILWTESGEKIISLFVEENGLTSETTTQTINIIPLPTVYAGQDVTVYAGESYLISDADAGNYESLSWSTSGDGTFNDTLILHPVYTPGQNDIINGNVSLTLSVSSECGNENDDILLSIEHLSLSGLVFTGNDYLESGVVLIFDVNQSYYLPVQYTFVNNGNYNFEGLSIGNYVVYAIPNPFQVTGYFPTYYVNQLFWWNAVEIDLFGNAYDVDIHLV
ncbi:MAG: right-handed parallel beta-helix repeat-containing protein, partial [Bacteroidales bacterium]|nr:right-handed parallel beta-helix repeat-containing protein [Bacteroidales bacterium]